MILPEKMAKVEIITHKKYKKKIIEGLYQIGVLHINDYEKGEFEIGKPLEEAEEISRILLKLRNTLSKLPKIKGKKQRKIKTKKEVERLCENITNTLEKINSQQKEIENKIKKIEKYMKIKHYLDVLGINANAFWDSKKVSILSGIVKNFDEKTFNKMKTLVLKYAEVDKLYAVYIIVKKDDENEVRKILQENGFVEFDYSFIKEMKNLKAEKELEILKKKSKELKKQIEDIAKEYRKALEEWKIKLEEEAKKAEAPLKFAESKSTILIEGWVPFKEREKIVKLVREITGDKAYIKIEEVKRREEAPVKLSHHSPVKSFIPLLKMYSLPKYSEVDPTIFMFITFPIYFGFMLGDIGYGLITLLLAIIAKRKIPSLKDLSNILILASVSSIFFGFVYGEFFGAEEIFGIKLPHIMARLHSINELLLISVIFGLIHINIGLLLGFVNEYIEHDIKKAILEKGSWLIVELGGILFFFYWKNILAINPLIPGIIFIIGVIMLAKGEGFIGVVELPTFLSHVLSFSRLMGVGVASASLALVINNLSSSILTKGFVFLPLVILMLILGHTINILLGLLECSLHSLRLNWVEFFTKFYKGGGIPYTPFGKKLRGE